MARVKRAGAAIEADREARRVLASLGADLRVARKRRRLTQVALAARVGMSGSAVSRIERGETMDTPLAGFVRLTFALGLRPRFELARDPLEELADAGHLAIQELLLRLGREIGYTATFELPLRAADPSHSIDVCLRDPVRHRLVLLEAWNTIGDIGAAARSFDRKLAGAAEAAAALHGVAGTVRGAWVVRATRRNRELVARYPAVFSAKLPGSSTAWARALTTRAEPPLEPGLVWCDVAATRVFAWRRGPT
jgi:transcriptional regulator with XRE-family HTH domain